MVGEKKESRVSAVLGTKNIGKGTGWGELLSFFGHVKCRGSSGQLDMKVWSPGKGQRLEI